MDGNRLGSRLRPTPLRIHSWLYLGHYATWRRIRTNAGWRGVRGKVINNSGRNHDWLFSMKLINVIRQPHMPRQLLEHTKASPTEPTEGDHHQLGDRTGRGMLNHNSRSTEETQVVWTCLQWPAETISTSAATPRTRVPPSWAIWQAALRNQCLPNPKWSIILGRSSSDFRSQLVP
jgi:hypothetical protein